MHDGDAWFAPKHFGYGAGLPIRWQGWAVLALCLAVAGGAALLLPPPDHPVGFGLIVAADAAVFSAIAARRTRGGWRWRWWSGGKR
jgi:hypothetical protein